jgi:hypothetical protein
VSNSLSTGKSGGRVATFLPPDRLVILMHFLQRKMKQSYRHDLVLRALQSRLYLRQVWMRFGEERLFIACPTTCILAFPTLFYGNEILAIREHDKSRLSMEMKFKRRMAKYTQQDYP